MIEMGRCLSRAPTLRTLAHRAAVIMEGVTECQDCGHDGSTHRLEVHHLDENPTNNDPANLRKLCNPCHHARHPKPTGRSVCSVDGCSRPLAGRGLCHKHYQRARKEAGGSFPRERRTCEAEGCDGRHYARGLCQRHYMREYMASRAERFGASGA
jgi:hypothetical protein